MFLGALIKKAIFLQSKKYAFQKNRPWKQISHGKMF